MKPAWKAFLNLCLKTHNANELSELLEFFLTAEEKESIADRYVIVKALLENKMTQREIAKKCNVSIAKITRGSNALKSIDSRLLQKLAREGERN